MDVVRLLKTVSLEVKFVASKGGHIFDRATLQQLT
jgi:hypothetical protein